MDELLGLKCTFETQCAWTWDEGLPDGFGVYTGENITTMNKTGVMVGPTAGEFFCRYPVIRRS